MKALFILVILAACGGINMQQYSERELKTIYEMACMNETNVTESEYKKYLSNELKASEVTANLKCMMKCAMEKRGMLKNGVLDTKRAQKLIMLVAEPKGQEDDVKEAVDTCQAEKGGNACETAFKITMCLKEFKSRKM